MKDFDGEFQKIIEDCNAGQRDELLSRIESGTTASVIVFGAGIVGEGVAENLKDFGAAITAFCDNAKTGVSEKMQLPIITPKQLCENYKDAIIVVAASERYNGEIYNQVLGMGFSKDNVFRRHNHYTLLKLDEITSRREGYQWAYDFFKDDLSKKIVLDRIRMYLTGIEMPKTSSCVQYFEPLVVKLRENEVFVDGGAYTGDTAEEFIRQVNKAGVGRYKKIYSFEPGEPACGSAQRNLAEYSDIEIIAKGLWSYETTLKFNSDGGTGASFIYGDLTVTVPVTSLDSFFAGKQEQEKPTFIKMDIEGAEKEALLGAEGIIRKNRPKLAVCVYHRPEDIYELTQLIYSFNPDYSLSLHRYENGLIETVLYAV